MLLTKREFFSRKNRNTLYLKYTEDYIRLCDLRPEYETTKNLFDAYIKAYAKKKYIYNYLLAVKKNINENLHCSTDLGLYYDIKDYNDLHYAIYDISRSIDLMKAAMEFIQYLVANKLIIRRP